MVAPVKADGMNFSQMPVDIKEQILIQAAKDGSFASLVRVNRQIRGIAKDMLAVGPDHRPLSARGQKLLKARAIHYLTSAFDRKIEDLPSWLQNEPKVLLAALKKQIIDWQQINPNLKENPDYIFKALKINPRLIRDICLLPNELRHFKKALSLPLDGLFENLSLASMTNGQLKVWACMFVHLNRETRRFGMLNPLPLLTQKLTFCEMVELSKVLVGISIDAIEHIPLNKKLVLEIVKVHGHTLDQLPSKYRLDAEIAIEAIRGRPNCFSTFMKGISSTLKAKPDFMKDAIRANGNCIHHIPLELRNNPSFMLDACIINPHALKYLGDDLRGDQAFFASIAHLNDGTDSEVSHLFVKRQKKWEPKPEA
jgi:hypothetical protein